MVKVERVTIVGHPHKEGVPELTEELSHLLEKRGIEVSGDDPDLVLAIGGDGTMLRAAQCAHTSDALLLGVNFGTTGYLTEIEAGHERGALERIFAGDFDVEERMMLACTTSDGDEISCVGLNEVLVERSARHRLVRLHVRVGGEDLATINADGIIVATPTGSTAYALSAGGPIVSPRAHCLVVVPVSAHMLMARPFVLAPDEVVEITVESGDGATFSLDGAIGGNLDARATVVVARHQRPLKLVRLSGPRFLERLRTKLNLPR